MVLSPGACCGSFTYWSITLEVFVGSLPCSAWIMGSLPCSAWLSAESWVPKRRHAFQNDLLSHRREERQGPIAKARPMPKNKRQCPEL